MINSDNENKAGRTDDKGSQKGSFLSGRLSWRVTLSVFFTIVIVQAAVLYFTAQNYEQRQLDMFVERGKTAIIPLLDHKSALVPGEARHPITPIAANRLIANTPIRGFAVYQPLSSVIDDVYGETPILSPEDAQSVPAGMPVASRSEPGDRYEVLLQPRDLKAPYSVVLRLNTEEVRPLVTEYILQTLLINLLLSGVVTSVLMIVLGKWLLEPIQNLKNNLVAASKEPTNPDKYQTEYPRRDELGSVIATANRLIRENADNINRLNKQAEDRIYKLAYFDNLTGLPNRTHFLQKLEESIRDVSESQGHNKIQICVMVMDLDHFGDINDTMGFEAGDIVLKEIAFRLLDNLKGAMMISRLGEDEYGVMIAGSNVDDEFIRHYTGNLFKAFAKPYTVQKTEFHLNTSVGVARFPADAEKGIELLKKAENALDQAKQEEKGTYRVYTGEFDRAVQERIQMVRDLRDALELGQFTLNYQPQIDAKTQGIVGAEALIRWIKPGAGPEGKDLFIRPDLFIPVAEQSGLIVPIGKWVLREACRFNKSCQDAGLPPFRVAVNISGVQFHRDDIVELTKQTLEETGLDPKWLELEVTESALITDLENTIVILQKLRELGVELAIDDFGTGYSSLSYLKRFPLDRLKIDRSFIMDLTEDPDDAAITQTIIQLGHSMGLKVIAEGTETIEHVEILTEEGCDEFQGYFFSKPLPAAEMIGFVKGRQSSMLAQAHSAAHKKNDQT